MKRKPQKKQPETFMHLRCDDRFKSVLKVEAKADGRTLSNYVFALIDEARAKRKSA